MPVHHEQRLLPYTAEQLFDLVVTIERYPEFIPWCLSARINDRRPDGIDAEMLIGFKLLRERFSSAVTFKRPHWIEVRPTAGPFRRMTNSWRFEDQADGQCLVDFYVDFEFSSRLLNKLMGKLFYQAVRRMVGAFERRARQLHGPAEAIPERRSA